MEYLFVVLYFEIFDFAWSNWLKEVYNLFFHLIVIVYKHMLPSSFGSTSPYQIKTNAISDAYCMCCTYILFSHHWNSLYDFICIWNPTVSDQYCMPEMILHLLFYIHNIQQWCKNFSASHIGIHFLYDFDGLL